jgi:predicted nuclease of restriction endonuclease-like (RecB) superfamily
MKLTKTFFEDIRGLIHSARATVARGVDLVQVYTNFEIGRRIVEQEQKGKGRAEYGEEVIRQLAERLTAEFGIGFSARNLASMKSFYLQYQDRRPILQSASAKLGDPQHAGALPEILQSLTAKSQSLTGKLGGTEISQSLNDESSPIRPFCLSWTHYVFLLSIKNPDERSFYEIEAANESWTVRELKRQFDSSLYERLALSRDKAGIRKLAQKGQIIESIADVLKEPLVLEVLGLDEQPRFSENDLESAILNHIEHFLLELGKGFLFEARQRRFTFDGEHFFVDLVFYNRLLRCYVLIDLKLGRLTHQNLGQMLMYVNTFDREIKLPDENPTVGIVLCRQKNKAIVEITLPKGSNIHASEYQLYLPSKELLQTKLMEWAKEVEK